MASGPFALEGRRKIPLRMNTRPRLLKVWALLSAGWIVGLDLLLGLLILRYQTILWGWFDLSKAIDWPKLIEANLVPPLLLGAMLAVLGLGRARNP